MSFRCAPFVRTKPSNLGWGCPEARALKVKFVCSCWRPFVLGFSSLVGLSMSPLHLPKWKLIARSSSCEVIGSLAQHARVIRNAFETDLMHCPPIVLSTPRRFHQVALGLPSHRASSLFIRVAKRAWHLDASLLTVICLRVIVYSFSSAATADSLWQVSDVFSLRCFVGIIEAQQVVSSVLCCGNCRFRIACLRLFCHRVIGS